MTHEQTEAAIAKAELAFFRAHPLRSSDSVSKSSVEGDQVRIFDLRGKVVAAYRITVRRFSVEVALVEQQRSIR